MSNEATTEGIKTLLGGRTRKLSPCLMLSEVVKRLEVVLRPLH